MPNLIVPMEALVDWVQAQIDDEPTLADCWLYLIAHPLIIDRYTTLPDLYGRRATFPGFAPQQLGNWSEAIESDDGAYTEADPAAFESVTPTSEMMYGCFATNATATRLWFATLFDVPLPTPFEAELRVVIQWFNDSIFNS